VNPSSHRPKPALRVLAKGLQSVYLRTIDHKRKVADNSAYFQHFYEQVCLLFLCLLSTFHMYLLLTTVTFLASRKD
jgi:hypothetical protein